MEQADEKQMGEEMGEGLGAKQMGTEEDLPGCY
jgi:hypothetical protein